MRNVQELNSLTDYAEAKIVEYSNGAKFETSEPIRFTLYANGIALFNGPFRPFSDALTRKFCIDLMDGYYPSELESRYPDGKLSPLTTGLLLPLSAVVFRRSVRSG